MRFKKDNGDLHFLSEKVNIEFQWNPFSSGVGIDWYIDTDIPFKWVKPRLKYFSMKFFGLNITFQL